MIGLFIMVKRISVYIDGANFYGGISNFDKKFTDWNFDFEKFINGLIGNNKVVKIYYYNGYVKKSVNENVWKKQNNFFNRLKKLKKWDVILCRKQKCYNGDHTFYFKLKEDDINLAINALADAFRNKYDKLILISSDRDFIPLIREIKILKKETEICYFDKSISKRFLIMFERKNQKKITKNIVKKYFLRKNKNERKNQTNITKDTY